jgi:hypothetical protein
MTVQDLIEELNKIEDKSKPVTVQYYMGNSTFSWNILKVLNGKCYNWSTGKFDDTFVLNTGDHELEWEKSQYGI